VDGSGGRSPTRRLILTPGSWALIGGGILLALGTRNVLVAARRPIGWAIAACVLAAALENPVRLVARHVRRGVALILVAVPILAIVGLVTAGVIQDLDREVGKLRRDIPEAAAALQRSERFGSTARRLDLKAKADEISDRIQSPSRQVAGRAAGRASSWFLVGILTVFALGWGPRMGDAALHQLPEGEYRDRVARVVGRAFRRTQFVVDVAFLQAIAIGTAAWAVFSLVDVRAPTALALIVGVTSMVPGIGVLLGALPAVLLEGTLDSWESGSLLFFLAVATQCAQTIAQRRYVIDKLFVGPAVVILGFMIGMDVYGMAGAVFGTAFAIFGLALIDAIGAEQPDDATEAERVRRRFGRRRARAPVMAAPPTVAALPTAAPLPAPPPEPALGSAGNGRPDVGPAPESDADPGADSGSGSDLDPDPDPAPTVRTAPNPGSTRG
jgi:predicted PurR-regulated permease PerM